jgi:hypothetical protein
MSERFDSSTTDTAMDYQSYAGFSTGYGVGPYGDDAYGVERDTFSEGRVLTLDFEGSRGSTF